MKASFFSKQFDIAKFNIIAGALILHFSFFSIQDASAVFSPNFFEEGKYFIDEYLMEHEGDPEDEGDVSDGEDAKALAPIPVEDPDDPEIEEEILPKVSSERSPDGLLSSRQQTQPEGLRESKHQSTIDLSPKVAMRQPTPKTPEKLVVLLNKFGFPVSLSNLVHSYYTSGNVRHMAIAERELYYVLESGEVFAGGQRAIQQPGYKDWMQYCLPVAMKNTPVNRRIVRVHARNGDDAHFQCDDGVVLDLNGKVVFENDPKVFGSRVKETRGSKNFTLFLTEEGHLFMNGKMTLKRFLGWGVEDLVEQVVDYSKPTEIVLEGPYSGQKVVMIAAGLNHALLTTDQGAVLSWGAGGLLGNGRLTSSATLVPVLGLPPKMEIKNIYAFANSSFIVLKDESIWGFGNNSIGVLGTQKRAKQHLIAKQVKALPRDMKVHDIVGGEYPQDHILFLAEDGRVGRTGGNRFKQAPGDTLIPLPEGLTATAVCAGFQNSLILLSNGEVMALGDNWSGFLGTPNSEAKSNRFRFPYCQFTNPEPERIPPPAIPPTVRPKAVNATAGSVSQPSPSSTFPTTSSTLPTTWSGGWSSILSSLSPADKAQ